MDKQACASVDGAPAVGPYSPALAAEQASKALENMRVTLAAAGLQMDDVVKTTVFLQDMDDFAAVNDVYAQFFRQPYPARSAVQVARLPKDLKVEIDAIAVQ